jgi:hypothetical protein
VQANVRGIAIGIDTNELAETASSSTSIDNSDSRPLVCRSTVAMRAQRLLFVNLNFGWRSPCRERVQTVESFVLAAFNKRVSSVQICRKQCCVFS